MNFSDTFTKKLMGWVILQVAVLIFYGLILSEFTFRGNLSGFQGNSYSPVPNTLMHLGTGSFLYNISRYRAVSGNY